MTTRHEQRLICDRALAMLKRGVPPAEVALHFGRSRTWVNKIVPPEQRQIAMPLATTMRILDGCRRSPDDRAVAKRLRIRLADVRAVRRAAAVYRLVSSAETGS